MIVINIKAYAYITIIIVYNFYHMTPIFYSLRILRRKKLGVSFIYQGPPVLIAKKIQNK